MWPLLSLWLESKLALRIACAFVVAGWLLQLGMFVFIIAIVVTGADGLARFLFLPQTILMIIIAGAGIALANVALVFPRCARCSKPLFEDSKQNLISGGVMDIRHHRAKTLFNSYRQGAVFELARTGRLNCSYCGHELGTKPDYVVSAPR